MKVLHFPKGLLALVFSVIWNFHGISGRPQPQPPPGQMPGPMPMPQNQNPPNQGMPMMQPPPPGQGQNPPQQRPPTSQGQQQQPPPNFGGPDLAQSMHRIIVESVNEHAHMGPGQGPHHQQRPPPPQLQPQPQMQAPPQPRPAPGQPMLPPGQMQEVPPPGQIRIEAPQQQLPPFPMQNQNQQPPQQQRQQPPPQEIDLHKPGIFEKVSQGMHKIAEKSANAFHSLENKVSQSIHHHKEPSPPQQPMMPLPMPPPPVPDIETLSRQMHSIIMDSVERNSHFNIGAGNVPPFEAQPPMRLPPPPPQQFPSPGQDRNFPEPPPQLNMNPSQQNNLHQLPPPMPMPQPPVQPPLRSAPPPEAVPPPNLALLAERALENNNNPQSSQSQSQQSALPAPLKLIPFNPDTDYEDPFPLFVRQPPPSPMEPVSTPRPTTPQSQPQQRAQSQILNPLEEVPRKDNSFYPTMEEQEGQNDSEGPTVLFPNHFPAAKSDDENQKLEDFEKNPDTIELTPLAEQLPPYRFQPEYQAYQEREQMKLTKSHNHHHHHKKDNNINDDNDDDDEEEEEEEEEKSGSWLGTKIGGLFTRSSSSFLKADKFCIRFISSILIMLTNSIVYL